MNNPLGFDYQIIQTLNRNNLGGRVTYLAQNSQTQQQVVIKEFQFLTGASTWSEYDSYQQEIKVLKSLNHPGIPRYLDAFETANGFCMVQEYINAATAATSRSWTPEKIKLVAISSLEILVYLQSQYPSIIHRDIKPENILIDDKLKVYLVDFGFARLGGGDIAASSVVKGTIGFMPPEQLFNRRLTNASDLYALGATLICLLTGIKSVDISQLIDEEYRINFRHLIPPPERGWINWLEKMTEPQPNHRFKNAEAALEVIKKLNVSRLPRVRLKPQKLTFVAEEWGEQLSQTIEITNPVPNTILSGYWSVNPHPSDPPHTPYEHPYISFTPQKFCANKVSCNITIDTSKLLVEQNYNREIILTTNSDLQIYPVQVKIQTAPVKQFKHYLLSLSVVRVMVMLGFIYFGFHIYDLVTQIWMSTMLTMNAGLFGVFMISVFLLFGGFLNTEKYKNDGNTYNFLDIINLTFGGFLGGLIGYCGWFLLWKIMGFDSSVIDARLGLMMGVLIGCRIILFLEIHPPLSWTILGLMIVVYFYFCVLAPTGLLVSMLLRTIIFIPIILLIIYAMVRGFSVIIMMAIAFMFLSPNTQIFNRQNNSIIIAINSLLLSISMGAILRLIKHMVENFSSIETLEMIGISTLVTVSLSAILIPWLNYIIFQPLQTLKKYRQLQSTLIKP
ncbi:MAG: serine/threonine protein kinase [Arthrospira sp. SH-MAG29]|nr:serine/threonine-protein kinase [Arthrospira sp. SH-MAG29]MBS0018332.1 serine/threonine protein kinase [Arthrospira sp. SH-MAG29]